MNKSRNKVVGGSRGINRRDKSRYDDVRVMAEYLSYDDLKLLHKRIGVMIRQRDEIRRNINERRK